MENTIMSAKFSGEWTQDNQSLISKLNQLTLLVEKEFDIDISIDKMLAELSYRELVISELSQLAHIEVNDIITWLTLSENKAVALEQIKQSSTLKPSYLVLMLSFLLVLAGSFYWFTKLNITEPQQAPAVIKVANKPVEKINNTTVSERLSTEAQKTNTKAKNAITNESETVFRLHGSNTIGEKLAPMLLEGFLKQRGVTEMDWQQNAPLERTLHYQENGKAFAIELKAHGSSTGFASLNQGIADIGMSSRRIKSKETTALLSKVGDLNKLGNEHIIGLDGLAVIVNQNNAVKQLSNETLAKIFSGEINNWSQIGGAELPIKLFARDPLSGTWDTFKNLVLKKYNKKLSAQAMRFESSSELSSLVSQNEGAIGFIGLNYVLHNKAIAISESKETGAIFPTRFTISTEDYALARRLYFYTPTSATTIVKDFAQYSLSTSGQEIVATAGLISQNIKLEQVYPLAKAPKKYKDYAETAKRLSLNFRFDYATKDLDNKGKRDLQRLVEFMEEHQSRRVVLMGFSDSIGAKTKNNQLSLKRAKSVELALTSRGIPVLAVEAMGEALPIANNNTEAGRKRNRRVELWLL